jgi:hypothetical protein
MQQNNKAAADVAAQLNVSADRLTTKRDDPLWY